MLALTLALTLALMLCSHALLSRTALTLCSHARMLCSHAGSHAVLCKSVVQQ